MLKTIYPKYFTGKPKPKDILTQILELNISAIFPNVCIAFRIFLTIPASVSTAERSFSVLNRIKNYSRATTGQERLNGLATLNFNHDVAKNIDFTLLIDTFARTKARKAL